MHGTVNIKFILCCLVFVTGPENGDTRFLLNVGTFQTLTKCQITSRINPPFIRIVLSTVLVTPTDTCIGLADSIQQRPSTETNSL